MKKTLYPAPHCKNIFENHFIAVIVIAILITSCNKPGLQPVSAGAADNIFFESKKPNIILIVADDVGYEVPTYTGGESYSTPTLDLLSEKGMQFTQCQASPSCSPSRIMMMTGKYSFRNYTVWSVLDTTQRTIANMLKDAGYMNFAVGKWQFDGGDTSIKKFGFDQYTIFEPYAEQSLNKDNDPRTKGRYKSPELYSNGKFLNPDDVVGKYSEDIMQDSLITYIKRSKAARKPFFAYYALSLCHQPFSPTPDDPEYAAWDPTLNQSIPSFYPSMVKYMDKKIGELMNGLYSMGTINNTVIIFAGDNGTQGKIISKFRGGEIRGGKQGTEIYGTHVPLLVYWNGKVSPGSISDVQIDFTDILATIAGIANVPVPVDYGTLDGISFYPFLAGQNGIQRNWTFCHFYPEHTFEKPLQRWIQDVTYKLYDSTGYFYNIISDSAEEHPLINLTVKEQMLKDYFQQQLDLLH